MAVNHHGNGREQSELRRLFIEQLNGTAKREWAAGRMGADDDGTLTYAMTNDDRRRTIVIRFPKPVEWIGLGVSDAEELIQQLTERVMALKGIKANC